MSLDKLKNLLNINELNYNYTDSSELIGIVKKIEEEADDLYYSMNDEEDAELVKITFKKIILELKHFVDARE